MFIITLPLYKNGSLTLDSGEYIGYSTMVIALSMVFFGIKSYRDNQMSGVITFGKGFQVGLLISLVAALFYALGWEFFYNVFYPDFMDQYADMCMAKARSGGADAAELQRVSEQVATMRSIYKSPLLRFAMTMMEIFPVGLVIALLSALVLRKREVLPA